MKRITKLFCTIAMLLLLSAASAFAFGTTISSLNPDKNVGVFEKTDTVSFTATLSNAKSEDVLVIVKDINSEVVFSKEFAITAGASSLKLDLGSFDTGWYRIYLCDISGNAVYNKYAAFVVTEPYSSRTIYEDAPLAVDTRVAEYKGDAEKFGDAYKLMGISECRERAYYGGAYGGNTNLGAATRAYNDRGISTLAVWTPDNTPSIWRDDLAKVYSWQAISARELGDRVNAWEIVNEPDSKSGLPADLYSAYLKAAALAVYDTNPDLKKSFGAVCNTTSDDFARYMMQNGVMNYADTYNVHTHQDGSDTYSFRPIISEIIKTGRLFSTIYGGGAPVWVSESGLRMNLSTGNLPTQGAMKTQAAYAITSLMKAIEDSGADKYFFFLGTHYIEGNKEYGIFSENNMPFPAVSSLSTLTYYLGKGDYLGELKGIKGNTKALVFDTGENRAVVIYNTSSEKGNVQIDTKEDAVLVDLVGGTRKRIPNQYHNKINVPVSDTPMIVLLGDDNVRYQKKEFENNTENKTITNNERLIIQPLWPENLQVSGGRYILEQGETYNITLKVYNMSKSLLQGPLNFKGTDQIEITSEKSDSYRLRKDETKDITVTIKVKDDATPLSEGYFSASGQRCTPSVSVFRISDANVENIIESKKQISNFYTEWKRNDSASTRSYTTSGTTAKVSVTWNTQTSAWVYPKKAVNENAGNYDGFYVKVKMDKIGNSTTGIFNFNVYLNGIIANAGKVTETEKTFYVPFENFAGLDTSNITEVRVGFTEFDGKGTFAYTVSDMGFYTTSDLGVAYERPQIVINTENNKVYRYKSQPNSISADIAGEISDIKVYVNYKEYSDFEISGNRVIIDTEGLESGAKNIIVTGRDAFNYAVFDQVNFYIGETNEWHPKGVFF